MSLPRPGAIGIAIRLLLAGAVGFMGYSAASNARGFFDGLSPGNSLGYVIPLAIFSSWVVNELLQTKWGWRPTIVLLVGLGAAAGFGASQGDSFGPPFGIYVWSWTVAFAALLAPAHLLAALLRTPGCEMRSYKHLIVKLRGGDVETVACPGWIDRFDGVRLR